MFKKILIKNRNMDAKILRNMILIAVIPIVLSAVFIFNNYAQNNVKDYRNSIDETLAKSVQLINSEMIMYVKKSDSITQNRYLIENLSEDYGDDLEKMMVFFTNLDILIAEPFGSNNEGYFSVYPFNESIYEGSSIERYDRIKDDAFIQDVVKQQDTSIKWAQNIYTKKVINNNTKYIKFYRNIIDFQTPMGLLEGNIPYSRIEQLIQSTAFTENGLTYLKNDNNEILFFKNTHPKGIQDYTQYRESKFLSVSQKLINGFELTVAVPWSTIRQENIYTLLIILITLIIFIIILFVVSKYSVNKITGKLKNYIENIREDDVLLLNLETIDVSGDDEVAVIKRKFKELITRINTLYTETTAVKLEKSSFELELLQSRINPHLLYNSLSVIKWNAQWNKDIETANLIDSMTKYYRTALNRGNNIIKISDELEMVKEYIEINEYSYTNKFCVNIDFVKEVYDYYTIKHLLQPVVENAILHGLNGKEEGAVIDIKGRMDGKDIIISIKDNGIGMKKDMIDNILKMNYTASYGGYGVKNLIKRIEMYYGDGYGLNMESKVNIGTEVTIRIKALDKIELEERFKSN